MNLYEISARFQQLVNKDEFAIDDLKNLDELQLSAEDKAIDYAKYIRNLESEPSFSKTAWVTTGSFV